jgi:subtilase family serine protease
MSQDTRRIVSAVLFASLAVLLIAVPAFSASSGRALPNAQAQVLGAEDPTKDIRVNFWLNQHDKAGFDELVRQMYDRSSPNYHKWLTAKEYAARFAPTPAEMAIVKQHLAANNLKVVFTDKLNLVVTAHGTVADVQRATGVRLNRVTINGHAHRLPSSDLAIPGLAGKLIAHVQGLNDFKYENHAKRPINPDTGKAFPMTPLSKMTPLSTVGPATQYFNANCLGNKQGVDFTGPVGTEAHYTGTRYGDNISNGPPNLPPCGYDAPQIDTAYGLTSLYSSGLDGTGQTIDIVDAYGSDTITSDANIFASLNGLPALVPGTNFNIYYPGGPTSCGNATGPGCGWDVETSLDVEWSHSVAPGANIALYLGLTNNNGDLDIAVTKAIEDEFAPVISNSYGEPEVLLLIFDPDELDVENALNELGASFGISVNFSSADDGDFYEYLLDNYGIAAVSVSAPSNSPYATGVGGTSLFVTTAHKGQTASIKEQTGWGNNLTRIAGYATSGDTGQPPIVPPLFEGFYAGAGGGYSYYFPEPAYQSNYGLESGTRLVPDIAMVADPYTGVEFIDTESGDTFISVVGGTSLACPTFSGIWAIANQAAPYSFIGQAAPILYGLPAGAITDIVAINGPANVSGHTHVVGAHPATVTYTSAELLEVPSSTPDFIGTLYNGTSTRWYALSFGTDSSLNTGPGWDDVTGLGTPNGATFVNDVAASIP